MTVKQFFKSTAFKCIAVLMCVLLVSGVLLAICWGFLEVTEDERFNRKINAVYGGEKVTATAQDISDKSTSLYGATIEKVWLIEEKNDYLVQAYSRGNGGNITCWVAVNMDENLTNVQGITKVIVYSVADAAEYIMNLGDNIYNKFVNEYEDGKFFDYYVKGSEDFISTGATYSLTAVCNDVNAAVAFVKGEKDPYEAYLYRDFVDFGSTTWTASGTAVNYTIVTKGSAPAGAFTISITVDKPDAYAAITNYEITAYGSVSGKGKTDEEYNALVFDGYKDYKLADVIGLIGTDGKIVTGGVISTGATRSNEQCVYAAAFALANYETCLNTPKGGN